MISQLPLYSQQNPSWSSMRLGRSGLLMRDWGCTVTASAMAVRAFGKRITPGELCAKLNANGGFDASGSLSWLKVAEATGTDFGYRWDTSANTQPNHSLVVEAAGLQHVEWLASVGIPTVCWVDTNHDGKPNHFVTYIGEGMVNDPWDGQRKPMLSVFRRLYGYAIFNGDAVFGTKVTALISKANEIRRGRNVALNAQEIMDVVNRP